MGSLCQGLFAIFCFRFAKGLLLLLFFEGEGLWRDSLLKTIKSLFVLFSFLREHTWRGRCR